MKFNDNLDLRTGEDEEYKKEQWAVYFWDVIISLKDDNKGCEPKYELSNNPLNRRGWLHVSVWNNSCLPKQ